MTLIPLVIQASQATRKHEIYFKGSDYELHVFRLTGHNPGKTLLLIGGIQGDEPGGYLSADLYSDLELETGNLIIVPRANFKSIILGERGPDGDMNRQFHEEAKPGPMREVVDKLKGLMSEADLFLHLHDGWGYYRPDYIDNLRNPNRYGQSIIADTDNFACTDGDQLQLETMAKQILEKVNAKIANEEHHLHFFNTKTTETGTAHKAMRKTATYYALRQHCLPAFGVEASKNLPSLELKILYHNLVINEFMRVMNIVPVAPRVKVPKAQLYLATIEINDQPRQVMQDTDILIRSGDKIRVTDIATSAMRGVSCDLAGQGDLNDLGEAFVINEDSQLIVRHEGQVIGSINILTDRKAPVVASTASSTATPAYSSVPDDIDRVFIVTVNNVKKVLFNNQTLTLNRYDNLNLISTFGKGKNTKDTVINFKGWVPDTTAYNNGDDRNLDIVVGKTEFMKRYSKNGNGLLFPVVAETRKGKKLGEFWVRINNTDATQISSNSFSH